MPQPVDSGGISPWESPDLRSVQPKKPVIAKIGEERLKESASSAELSLSLEGRISRSGSEEGFSDLCESISSSSHSRPFTPDLRRFGGSDIYIVPAKVVVKPGRHVVLKAELAQKVVGLLQTRYLEVPNFQSSKVNCISVEDVDEEKSNPVFYYLGTSDDKSTYLVMPEDVEEPISESPGKGCIRINVSLNESRRVKTHVEEKRLIALEELGYQGEPLFCSSEDGTRYVVFSGEVEENSESSPGEGWISVEVEWPDGRLMSSYVEESRLFPIPLYQDSGEPIIGKSTDGRRYLTFSNSVDETRKRSPGKGWIELELNLGTTKSVSTYVEKENLIPVVDTGRKDDRGAPIYGVKRAEDQLYELTPSLNRRHEFRVVGKNVDALMQSFVMNTDSELDLEAREADVAKFLERCPFPMQLELLAYCMATLGRDSKLGTLKESNFLFTGILEDPNPRYFMASVIDYDELFALNPDINWELSLQTDAPVVGVRCSLPALPTMEKPLAPDKQEYLLDLLDRVFEGEGAKTILSALRELEECAPEPGAPQKKIDRLRRRWHAGSDQRLKSAKKILEKCPELKERARRIRSFRIHDRVKAYEVVCERYARFKRHLGKPQKAFSPLELWKALYPVWGMDYDRLVKEPSYKEPHDRIRGANMIGTWPMGFRSWA